MIFPNVSTISGGAIGGPPSTYVYPYLEQAPELSELLTTTVALFVVCLVGQTIRHAMYYHWLERAWDFLNSPVVGILER